MNTNLKMLNINASYPGARNDSYIWSMSLVLCAMEYHYNNDECQTLLIGKSIYFENNSKSYIKQDFQKLTHLSTLLVHLVFIIFTYIYV